MAESLRILVVGAGAVGGYFGGRLLEAGRDITFLVRKKRAADLLQNGLKIRSRFGDFAFAKPRMLVAGELTKPFDIVLLSCKAYDLASAIESIAPAVGPETTILPLLNGIHHLEVLDAHFGIDHVLGGACYIFASRDSDGVVVHKNDVHTIVFGGRDRVRFPGVEAITAAFTGAKFDHRLSEIILQEMWEKWVFVATVAGITCLMRASIGDITRAGAGDLATSLFNECALVAASQGISLRAEFLERTRQILTTSESPLASSMLHDIERCAPVEADHILGDLIRHFTGYARGQALLRIAYAHLKTYEARRERESPA